MRSGKAISEEDILINLANSGLPRHDLSIARHDIAVFRQGMMHADQCIIDLERQLEEIRRERDKWQLAFTRESNRLVEVIRERNDLRDVVTELERQIEEARRERSNLQVHIGPKA